MKLEELNPKWEEVHINMPTCTFCKKNFKEPRGLTIFTFDGKAIYFCSSKCRRNMEHLKRDPKKVNWVKKHPDYNKSASISDNSTETKENNDSNKK